MRFIPVVLLTFLLCSSIVGVGFKEKEPIKYANVTIYVDDNGGADYTSIQDAIDNAYDGDTIFVYSGTYYEKIIINKSILIEGENFKSTSISYNGSENSVDNVILIESSNVTIKGFNITADNKWTSGIKISSGNNCIIKGNLLYHIPTEWNNAFGIQIQANDNLIFNNEFKNFYWCVSIMDAKMNTVTSNNFYKYSSIFPITQSFHLRTLTQISNFLIGNEFNNNFYDETKFLQKIIDIFDWLFKEGFDDKFIDYPPFFPFPIIIWIIIKDANPDYPNPIPHVFSLFEFDWNPASEPYDIQIT